MEKRVKLSEQIRQAIDASSLSRYRICKELGMAEATMSRFMNGQGGLSMEYLDALADLINLNITTGRRRQRKTR
jgi:transcriptional regulator with XRE-family HTH domain